MQISSSSEIDSSNSYDCKTTVIVSTLTILITGILLAAAYYLQWGTPAITSIACIGGLTLLAIVLSQYGAKKPTSVQGHPLRTQAPSSRVQGRTGRSGIGVEPKPVPAAKPKPPPATTPVAKPKPPPANLKPAPKNPRVPRQSTAPKVKPRATFGQSTRVKRPPNPLFTPKHSEDLADRLCRLIFENELESFEKELVDEKSLIDEYGYYITPLLKDSYLPTKESRDQFATLYTPLQVILMLSSEKKKARFLKVALSKLQVGTKLDIREKKYREGLLRIGDLDLIDQLLPKLSISTIKSLLNDMAAEENLYEQREAWLSTLIRFQQRDAQCKKEISERDLILGIFDAKISNRYFFLGAILKHSDSGATLENLEIDFNSHALGAVKKASLMFLAIEYRDYAFVEHLSYDCKELVNRALQLDGCSLTPLHRAVLTGQKEVVKRLLEKGADPNAFMEGSHLRKIFQLARPGATRMTPLMIAERMENQELVTLLTQSGAKTELTDHPEGLKAWKAENYKAEALSIYKL